MKLSIALAVYNEEKNIERCLAAVRNIADEIIVVDGGSTDRTLDIARAYKAKIIQTDNPAIFHINKQKALDACTGDWILQLDADEVITPELKTEIQTVIDDAHAANGYYIPRRNYFWGHFMKKGGQYPDEVIRLMRHGKGKFPCKSVHEQIEIQGHIGHLKNPMFHYSYDNRSDYWKKSFIYTTLTAHELRASGKNSIVLCIQYCLLKPIYTFLAIYIRHKGFVDGLVGLEFSLYSALHFPIAYWKYLTIPV